MEVRKYRVCGDLGSETPTSLTKDIQSTLGLANVRIDIKNGELSFENPGNCHVDEHMLEEAARRPGRNVRFEVCH